HRSVGLRMESALETSMRLGIAIKEKVPNHEVIHLAVDETTVSIIWGADDRFTAHVERCIDQRGATGGLLESLQQPVELRVLLATQRLDSRGIINMCYRGQCRPRLIRQIEPGQ